jgi:Ca-activated chloride channel family protein
LIKAAALLTAGLLGTGLFGATAQAATWKSFWHNREGVHQLERKAYFPAYQAFTKALADDPLNPNVQMNLGLTFEANEEYEKAEKAYRGVLHLAPEKSQMRFQALFNMAGALAKQEKIDEALGAYQAALEINPDSIEVKTNIELLWQGGQGNGKGKKQKKDDDKQGNNQQKRENQDPNQQDEQQKKQPKPFNSQDLSKEDVKRILDEIKNQEQSIRAQEYEKNAKDAPRGKDW